MTHAQVHHPACSKNELCWNRRQIVFIVDHGLDVEFHAVLEAVHWVVEGCDEERDGIDVVPTLDFLVEVAGARPDEQVDTQFTAFPW